MLQAELVKAADGFFQVGDRLVGFLGIELFGEISGVGVDHRKGAVWGLIIIHNPIISIRELPCQLLRKPSGLYVVKVFRECSGSPTQASDFVACYVRLGQVWSPRGAPDNPCTTPTPQSRHAVSDTSGASRTRWNWFMAWNCTGLVSEVRKVLAP